MTSPPAFKSSPPPLQKKAPSPHRETTPPPAFQSSPPRLQKKAPSPHRETTPPPAINSSPGGWTRWTALTSSSHVRDMYLRCSLQFRMNVLAGPRHPGTDVLWSFWWAVPTVQMNLEHVHIWFGMLFPWYYCDLNILFVLLWIIIMDVRYIILITYIIHTHILHRWVGR